MKKLTFILTLVLFSVGMTITTSAQTNQGDIFLEGGLGYGSEIQSLGIQAGVLYTINSQFRAGADAIYYFPGEDSHGLDFTWLEFNANGHYLFVDDENVTAYALAGLNFARLFSDHDNIRLPGGDSTDKLYVGLNIGAGVEIPANTVTFYIEGKYSLSSVHQLALTAGVRIPL